MLLAWVKVLIYSKSSRSVLDKEMEYSNLPGSTEPKPNVNQIQGTLV
jgi:hypothetical protein